MKFKVCIQRNAIQYFTVEADTREQAREIASEIARDTVIHPNECDDEILKVKEVKQ